jgi:hypothetical protein
MTDTCTILSTNAPLVEVSGDGPIYDVPRGATIPDGAATTTDVDLANAPIRRWRVDASPNVRTAVVVTDSPYGAFVGVRRRAAAPAATRGWPCVVLRHWQRVRGLLRRYAPRLVTPWCSLANDSSRAAWREIGQGSSHLAEAHGGDLIVVRLVSP